MVVDVFAISVSVLARLAVMVIVFAWGRFMNTLVEAVVKVKTPTLAESTAVMLAAFVTVMTVAFGALIASTCPPVAAAVIATFSWSGHDTL